MSTTTLIAIGNEIPPQEKGDRLYLSVPGELVCSISTDLPPLPKKNQEQVLGFALEDQIAGDLDDIKFVAQQKGTTAVLWCKRTHWEKWLADCEGLEAVALLPDYLYLPLEDDTWTIRIRDTRTMVRTSETTGFAIESSCLLDCLTLKLEAALDLPQALIIDGQAVVEPLKKLCGQYGLALRQEKIPAFSVPEGFNLSLSPQKKWRFKKPANGPWKAAAALAAVWVVVLVSGSIWKNHAMDQAIADYQKQLSALYHRVNPRHHSTAQVVTQLQHLERNLKQGEQPDPVMKKLLNAVQAIQAFPGVRLEKFDASPNKLSLQVSSHSLKSINHVVSSLKKRGLKVKESDLSVKPKYTTVRLGVTT